MKRTAIAFVAAPLWVPIVTAPYAAVALFPDHAQFHWVVIATVVSSVFAYGGVFGVGLPAFLFLRSRGVTNAWSAAILGVFVGALTGIVFLVCFGLFFGASIGAAVRTPGTGFWLLITGLLGLIVGVTFWIIARPDRTLSEK